MDKYEFDTTKFIAEAFEKHNKKFRVGKLDGLVEILKVGFVIDNGPKISMYFLNIDNNDFAVRIFELLSDIPEEKRCRVIEACNVLNREVKYMKFFLDQVGDVSVCYALPFKSANECVGEMAFEIFTYTKEKLNEKYSIFMKALYTDEDLEVSASEKILEVIRNLARLNRMKEKTTELLRTNGETFMDEDDNKCDLTFDY